MPTTPIKKHEIVLNIAKEAEARIKAITDLDIKLSVSVYGSKLISLEAILEAAEDLFDFQRADLKKHKLDRQKSDILHLCMYFAHTQIPEIKIMDIANFFDRERTSPLYAIEKIQGFLDIKDAQTIEQYEKIFNHFYNKK